MMDTKLFYRQILVVIVTILSMISLSMSQESQKQELLQRVTGVLRRCQKLTGASDADLDAISRRKIPETHEGLCLLECILNKAQIMKDGKFNKETAVKAIKPFVGGNPEMNKKVFDFMEKCESHVGKGSKDKCETAKMVAECSSKLKSNGASHQGW
nr:odorant-binding protein [Lasioderma serricorne]